MLKRSNDTPVRRAVVDFRAPFDIAVFDLSIKVYRVKRADAGLREADCFRLYASVVTVGNVADGVFLGWVRGCQQFLHRAEQGGNLPVVFVDLAGHIPVRGKDLAQPYKRADDGYVDLDGTITVEHTRKHGNALFREGIGRVPPPSPTT